MSPPERTAPAPEVVADHFVRQYYGGVVVNKGADLIRFYTEESTFTCATAKEAERVSGIAAIKAKIQQLGLEGADRVDLGGDIDVKPTGGGGVLIKVTGWITISGMNPRQFCQTFVLSREHRFTDRRNYFVRDEIFRFIDGPDVVQIQAENARKRQAPWPKTVAEIMSHKERRAMNKASKKKEKAEKASNGEEASRKEHRAMKKAFKKKKNESRACRPSDDLFPAGAPSVKPPRGRSRTRKSPVSLGKPVASGTRTQKRGAKPGSVAWEEAFSRAVGAVSKVDADACARKLSNPRLRKSGSEPRYVGRSPPQVPETCRRRQTRSFFGAAATDSVASYQSEDEGAGREERQRSSWSPVSSSSGRMASMKVHSKDEASEKAENDYGASDCGEGKSAQNMTVSVFGDIASACGEKQEGHGASEAPARSEKRSMTVSTIQTASPESRKVSVESTHPTVGAEDRSNGNADDSRRSSWMPREEQVEDADLAYEGSVSDDDEDDVYEEAGGAGSEGVKPPLPVQDNGQRELEMEDEAGRISADGTYSDRGMPMPATSSPRPVVGYSLARLGKGIKLLSWSLIILVAVCGSILFLDCRLCPCSRGNVLHPGDTALVPGECIAGANGSRHFGWLPWVSWKPTLFVGDSGEMIATRPDGKRITLWEGGMTKRNGFLSRVFSAPARSRLEARLHRLRRRGGHVRFSEVGDLYVADSTGRIVWSLAEEVEREGERQKMGEAKGLGGLENDILLVL